jgi:hypothetical protein
MRFDPKLIRSDEPPLVADGDLELPDDLAALAEQLGDDAVHLAVCYPPARTAILPQQSPASQRNRVAAAAAMLCGSALAAVLVTTVVLWRSAAPIANEAGSNKRDQAPQSSFTSASVGGHATVSLTDLSAPELEALLDLIDREPGHTISVSF